MYSTLAQHGKRHTHTSTPGCVAAPRLPIAMDRPTRFSHGIADADRRRQLANLCATKGNLIRNRRSGTAYSPGRQGAWTRTFGLVRIIPIIAFALFGGMIADTQDRGS